MLKNVKRYERENDLAYSNAKENKIGIEMTRSLPLK